MHELSLMRDLFKKIECLANDAKAKYVTKVCIELGALAHLSPEHFKEHFDELRSNTVAEFATLEIVQSHDIHDPLAQEIKLVSIDVAKE